MKMMYHLPPLHSLRTFDTTSSKVDLPMRCAIVAYQQQHKVILEHYDAIANGLPGPELDAAVEAFFRKMGSYSGLTICVLRDMPNLLFVVEGLGRTLLVLGRLRAVVKGQAQAVYDGLCNFRHTHLTRWRLLGSAQFICQLVESPSPPLTSILCEVTILNLVLVLDTINQGT